jgi:hypothetical protein
MKLKAKRFSHLQEIEAHEIGRPHFRMKNPFAAGLGDFGVYPIWDYYGVAASTACVAQTLFGVTQNQPFTITGGATFTKTKQTTSMTKASELSAPERMLVRGITAFTDNSMNQADVSKLLSQTYLNFFISTKSFLEVGILAKLPAGGGAWAQQFGATAATTIIGVTGNGMPSEHQGFSLTDDGAPGFSPTNDQTEIANSAFPAVDGVLITQGQNFGVTVDPTLAAHIASTGFSTAATGAVPPGIGVNLFIFLQGAHVRAVL